ncbi:hypothetical protein [Nodosilinea sp. LEGE 07088]|nr:hypothetical protein [Nodosilinea sp. LEGE 07088]
MMSNPEPQLQLPSRVRRLVRRVAMIAAVGCSLGLLAMRAGG